MQSTRNLQPKRSDSIGPMECKEPDNGVPRNFHFELNQLNHEIQLLRQNVRVSRQPVESRVYIQDSNIANFISDG